MQRQYTQKAPPGSRRYRVNEIRQHPEKRYAIFRRSLSGKSAYFRCILGSIDEATEVARQYASEAVAAGDFDFAFYVVRLEHRIGIEDGVMFDESLQG